MTERKMRLVIEKGSLGYTAIAVEDTARGAEVCAMTVDVLPNKIECRRWFKQYISARTTG